MMFAGTFLRCGEEMGKNCFYRSNHYTFINIHVIVEDLLKGYNDIEIVDMKHKSAHKLGAWYVLFDIFPQDALLG